MKPSSPTWPPSPCWSRASPAPGSSLTPKRLRSTRASIERARAPVSKPSGINRFYRIDSTTEDDRWPEFARTAADHGVLSTISLPLVARGEGLGALNLYSRRPSAFIDINLDESGVFANQAAMVLANARVYWDARELSENLQQAMQSRSVIDQAVGVIMATSGQSPDGAFQILVRASQRENRKLREIAAERVANAQQRSSG